MSNTNPSPSPALTRKVVEAAAAWREEMRGYHGGLSHAFATLILAVDALASLPASPASPEGQDSCVCGHPLSEHGLNSACCCFRPVDGMGRWRWQAEAIAQARAEGKAAGIAEGRADVANMDGIIRREWTQLQEMLKDIPGDFLVEKLEKLLAVVDAARESVDWCLTRADMRRILQSACIGRPACNAAKTLKLCDAIDAATPGGTPHE